MDALMHAYLQFNGCLNSGKSFDFNFIFSFFACLFLADDFFFVGESCNKLMFYNKAEKKYVGMCESVCGS